MNFNENRVNPPQDNGKHGNSGFNMQTREAGDLTTDNQIR